jgi:NAD(P)-dependent dehydrogenase (short-subunit alcohol dehydrogenase family)
VPPIVYHALLMSTTNPLQLDSAVIPVTGAASGIGLAIAKRLHAAGALPLLLDIDERRLEAARHEVFGDASPVAGAAPCTYVLDVRDSAAVDACFDTLRAHHGPVTHAVANAGVGGATNALQMTDAQWHAVMDVNLHGTMYFCRAAARQLVERGQGAIVTIGSIAGLMVKPDRVAYTSSKAAVIQMTRALALDLGPLGVRVNGVAPGVIDTPMLRLNPESYRQTMRDRAALQRLGTPDDIANVTLFLLSELASFVTGQTVVADGGLTLRYQ